MTFLTLSVRWRGIEPLSLPCGCCRSHPGWWRSNLSVPPPVSGTLAACVICCLATVSWQNVTKIIFSWAFINTIKIWYELYNIIAFQEPVNVGFSIEDGLSQFVIRERSVLPQVLEEPCWHSKVALCFRIGEPYLFNFFYYCLLHSCQYQNLLTYPSSRALCRTRFWMSVSASQAKARETVALLTPQASCSFFLHPMRSFIAFLFAISFLFIIFAYWLLVEPFVIHLRVITEACQRLQRYKKLPNNYQLGNRKFPNLTLFYKKSVSD